MIASLAWALVVVIAVALVAHGLGWLAARGLRRWARRTKHALDDEIVHDLAGPLRWVLPVVSLPLTLPLVPLPEHVADPLQHAALVLVIITAGWVALRTLRTVERIIAARYASGGEDLHARRVHTQVRAFRNIAAFLVVLLTLAFALMTFPQVRQVGAGLLASAGVAGIVVGFAAQRSIATVVAGVQLALAQPIRIDDVVVIDGYWGRVEEITLTYVVIRIWDERRLIVPVTRIMEAPFESWTRSSAQLLGTVELLLDLRADVEPLRAELTTILQTTPQWDGRAAVVQVTELRDHGKVVRVLVSAQESGPLFELRCVVRERLVAFIAEHQPEALLRHRAELAWDPAYDQRSARPAPEEGEA
ncbi:mechanosensitive ion channel family protein [Paraliomyxa miuraensis]|uniref:mechanosensitive ion channel family protein n=1 Tax=Paraliomyxa miuraensis TaxID=376150 RepID=UPI002254065A|nr:mechanosensitive ion channel domain-containing protein [Paraliomyxa miuraensis]MCX4241037.1 mechanosensitive ion channel family protein [Paraliomyxa miuraensis]